mmetsp:Transcript_14484/g.26214  ORF Transcript_14484/g.26214 Transcript_14484/m.26214 type:complete len:471 (+) Transcript_14484:35-1447(+)|eukprot:CAMPEP_0174280030 /NCGR_PEP_ID=MMETSP0809-20121228/304_1 /TAXON_ID=73025 ORGANISM="Eutreptiella gymnastica-like, Strain CCMP1594" /NCGR_SAMPLE_ID=MMETSP0809 /ASSEMBLY_ACC=CAM_ASM_000658 /LENGTH=470 /DNA_ID=CAMNT_0015372697 /DNA_START=35 /DNA_END=1447 /DNA_ORIENTATION=+
MQQVRRACARVALQKRFGGGGINPNQVGVSEKVVRTSDGVTVVEDHFDESLRTSQLDNGVKVMTKDNGGDIAQLTFLYKDGPVYENIFNAGISSFMKHALTKDSVTSSEFITKTFLQKAGIVVHAPTIVNKSWIEMTVEGTRDSLGQAAVMDKFWQSLLFPRFSAANVKEVRRLVGLETTEAKRDTPLTYVLDLMHKTAFKGTPLSHTSYCPGYNMVYPTSDSLFDRWDAHYGFGNIAVAATNMQHQAVLGALTGSPWLARAHNKLGGVTTAQSAYSGGEAYEVHHRAKEYDDQFVDVHSVYTGYGFKAPGRGNLKEFAAAMVVATALSNAVSPVLNNSWTAKRTEVFYKAYDTVGLMGLTTVQSTAPQLSGFKDALSKVASVKEDELLTQKNATLLKALDTADSWRGTQSCLIESFTTTGEPMAPMEIATAINAVTAADVKKVVDAMIAAPATLVHYGNSPCAPTLADL